MSDTAAMAAIEQDSFHYEALSYVRRHEIPMTQLPYIEMEMRVRSYREAIEPLNKLLIHIYAMKLPKCVIYADGRIEQQEIELTDKEKQMVADIHDLMRYEAQRVGLPVTVRDSHE